MIRIRYIFSYLCIEMFGTIIFGNWTR